MKRIFATLRSGIVLASLLALVAATGCSKDEPTRPGPNSSGKEDADIDRWMFDYMKTHYLWNEAVKKVKPDYSLEYEEFLEDVLKKVAAQNDVNHDDGHWAINKTGKLERSYFYSNIQRFRASAATKSIQTRGTRKQAEGLGIEMMFYIPLGQNDSAPYLLVIAAVTPGSPAANVGLKRGDLIAKVDGTSLNTKDARNKGLEKLLATESGKVEVTLLDLNTGNKNELTLTAATYDDNPIWLSKVFTTASGKKVGYLCYMSFNAGFEDPDDSKSTPHYDLALIDEFKKFQGVDELVLDLRYNGGGHVVSSAVLATLIAGNNYQGKVYARTTYNNDRKSKTPDIYRLGVEQYNTSQSDAKYDPIAKALASALGLKQVFVLCTGNTASASELVVNGLRGLDFKVNLIGSTTNGKNVGMEPDVKTFGDYTYDFSPITFYSENAKGFRDYGNGFEPDVAVEDKPFYEVVNGDNYEYHPLEWGDAEHDILLSKAMEWIETGVKPVPEKKAVATRAFGGMQLRTLRPVRVQNMVLLPRSEE